MDSAEDGNPVIVEINPTDVKLSNMMSSDLCTCAHEELRLDLQHIIQSTMTSRWSTRGGNGGRYRWSYQVNRGHGRPIWPSDDAPTAGSRDNKETPGVEGKDDE